MKVKDCMCGDVCCVKPTTKIYEVAKVMTQKHIGCVPVCDEKNCIVGIVTDRDIILRGIACDKDVKTTDVRDIMTCNVCTCDQNDDVSSVEQKMSTNQIRRIPVVDNNKIIGILTFGDLTHYYDEIGEQQICNTIEDICKCGGQAQNDC